MPKFNKEIEIEEVGRMACIGKVEIGDQVRYSKSGTGLFMINLKAVPNSSTEGVEARSNLMLHPSWLPSAFDPQSLVVNPKEFARAKARLGRAATAKEKPDPKDASMVARGKMFTSFQMNVFSKDRPGTLQLLLGDRFDDFCDEINDKKPEEFLALLRRAYEDPNFIYECRQQKNMEGELTNRMEIASLWRIQGQEDVEAWANNASGRTIDLTFDPKSVRVG